MRAVDPFVKRRLDRRLGVPTPNPSADEARRDDLAVIHHQAIAGTQHIREIADAAVVQSGSGLHHQKPRCVARRRWAQSDVVRRQIEIEEFGFHA
jgi:hypothetical protein